MVFNPIFFENTNDANGLNYFASPQKIGKSSYLFSNILNVYISDVSAPNFRVQKQTEQNVNAENLIAELVGATNPDFATNEILQKVISQNDFKNLLQSISEITGETPKINLEEGKKLFFALSGNDKVVMFSAEKKNEGVEIKSFASLKENKSFEKDVAKFINTVFSSKGSLDKIFQSEKGENKIKIFAVSEEKEVESGKIDFDLNSWDVLKKEKSAEKYSRVLKKEKVSEKVADENGKQRIIENAFTEILSSAQSFLPEEKRGEFIRKVHELKEAFASNEINIGEAEKELSKVVKGVTTETNSLNAVFAGVKKSLNEISQLLSANKQGGSKKEIIKQVFVKLTKSEKVLSDSLTKQTPEVNVRTETSLSNAYAETLKEIAEVKKQVVSGKISLKSLSEEVQKLLTRLDEISVEAGKINSIGAKNEKALTQTANVQNYDNAVFADVKKSLKEIAQLLSANKKSVQKKEVVKQVLVKLTESEKTLSESLTKQTPEVNVRTETASSNAYAETLEGIVEIKKQVASGKISLKNLSVEVQKLLSKLDVVSVENGETEKFVAYAKKLFKDVSKNNSPRKILTIPDEGKNAVRNTVKREFVALKDIVQTLTKNKSVEKIREREVKIASNNASDKIDKVEGKNGKALETKQQANNFNLKNDIERGKEKPSFEQKIAEHVKPQKVENQFLNIENKTEKVFVKPQPVEQSNLVKHLAKIIQQKEKTSIEFQLKPEHLGKVKVALDLINDTVKANITVENVHTKQMLENNLNELYSQLQKSGVLFKDVNISLSQNGNSHERYARSYKGNKKNARFKKIDEINEMENIQDIRHFGYNTYEYLI